MGEVNTLNDLVEQKRLSKSVVERIENRLSKYGKIKFELTALQKKAFGSKHFWCDDNNQDNLIIQGATSSGKTLIAEVMMANCLEQPGERYKVICLVPLKAMVTEKIHHISEDLGENRDIVGSSSDYQEYDEDILNGNYEVAVIVYEKFFAMLAQSSDLLTHCRILVVDELQMLNVVDRGPKLEFAIMKLKETTAYKPIRIIGLTTIDCDTNYVCKWLNVDQERLIASEERPVGLEEYVINTDGVYKKHIQVGERERPDFQDEKIEPDNLTDGELPIKNILGKGAKLEEKKRNLLLAVLNDMYEKRPDSKVVVFVNSKRKSREIAEYICKSGLFQRDNEFTENMEGSSGFLDTDEYIDTLKKDFLPYKVAFHNSSLSVQTREIIEKNFEILENGIHIIVATETLMIGMNMPVDAVILYDRKVHRQDQRAVELNPQDYKNYIGRAGRLGYYEGERQMRGKSYLFVEEKEKLEFICKKYIFPQKVNIESSLINADALVTAPYYLNLLAVENINFSAENILKLQENSFSNVDSNKTSRQYAEDILKYLKNAQLSQVSNGGAAKLLGQDLYTLSDMGKRLAPYALSLLTCLNIKMYFVEEGDQGGGMPYDITKSDITEDKYILDILYILCLSEEVERNISLKLPNIDDTVSPATQELYYKDIKEIKRYLEKKKNNFWDNSMLKQFLSEEAISKKYWDAALRAIVLSHWVKGEMAEEIKKSTGFSNISIITGDLARIAEVCSYQMEAAEKCLGISGNSKRLDCMTDGMAQEFYILSKRIKYGMSRELISIANRHVFGVSRNAIIQLGKAAREYYQDNEENNVVLLIREVPEIAERYLQPSQRKKILEQFDLRNQRGSFEQLITNLLSEDILISASLSEELKKLNRPESANDWFESFQQIFDQEGGIEPSLCRINRENMYTLSLVGEERFLIALHYVERSNLKTNLTIDDCRQYMDFFEQDDPCYKKIIVSNGTLEAVYPDIDILYMGHSAFAMLIALSIAEMNSLRCGALLRNVLWDLQGCISETRSKFWQDIIKNYRNDNEQSLSVDHDPEVILLYDKSEETVEIEKMQVKLQEYNLKSQIFVWGSRNVVLKPNTIVVWWINSRIMWQSKSIHALIQNCVNEYPDNLLIVDNDYGNKLLDTIKEEFQIDRGIIHANKEDAIVKEVQIMSTACSSYKYFVGLSYPDEEEQSIYFQSVAKLLAERFGKEKILFDKFHPSEFYGADADTRIKEMYEKDCLVDVVCNCSAYDDHRWCKVERRGIAPVIGKDPRRVLFVTVGNGESSLLNGASDMYIDGNKFDIKYVTENIIERVNSLRCEMKV